VGIKHPIKLAVLPLLAGSLLLLTGCPFFNQGLTIHSVYIENQTLSVGGRTQIRIQASTMPGRTIRYAVRAERGRILTGDPKIDENQQVVRTERETFAYVAPFTSRFPDAQGNMVQGDRLIIQADDGYSSTQTTEPINLSGDTMVYVKESNGAAGGELWAATVGEGGYGVTNHRQLKDRNNVPLSGGSPVVSPDGRQVAFVYYPGTGSTSAIYTLDSAGYTWNVTGISAMNVDPTWAPDSRQIAFASDRGGSNFDLYRVNTDREGNQPTRITTTSVDERYPSWNPSLHPERRSTLAVSVKSTEQQPISKPSDSWNLYLLNIESGSYFKKLTQLSNLGHFAWEPKWRSDGVYLTYTRFGPILNQQTSSPAAQRIYVADTLKNDEGYVLNINQVGTNVLESSPIWNPNGTEIAYLQTVSGTSGTVHRQLVNPQSSTSEFPRMWQDFTSPIPSFQINTTENKPRFPHNGLSMDWR
jgi:Tol biopolymer transport system component